MIDLQGGQVPYSGVFIEVRSGLYYLVVWRMGEREHEIPISWEEVKGLGVQARKLREVSQK